MEGNGYVLKLKRGNDEPQHVYIDRSYFVLRNLDNYDLKYLEIDQKREKEIDQKHEEYNNDEIKNNDQVNELK